MSVDLGFVTPQGLPAPGVDRYSIITLIFFIPYVLFQPPATVILRKLGPRAFLPAITFLWGAIMISKICDSFGVKVMLTHFPRFRIREEVGRDGRSPYHPWCSRGWFLPWMRLPHVHLVHPFRAPEALLRLLPHWLCRIRLCGHPRLWAHANEGPWRLEWMELDLHRG